jgi:bla regulator protein blaR1
MGNHAGRTRNGKSKPLLRTASAVALAVTLASGGVAARRAQSPNDQAPAARAPTPQWQIDAGGKMKFDVASVKPNTADPTPTNVNSNMALGPGDYYSSTGGLFSATNLPLYTYIAFAYKLSANQGRVLREQIPKWVLSNRFDIQARAQGSPTKDQMRLMMQSLLADRFKLVMHGETRQLPVYGLVLDKAGKLGPGLQPHSDSDPCSTDPGPMPAAGSAIPEAVVACGGIQAMPGSVPGRMALGARKVTMELFANSLPGLGNVDRPVLDKSGLSGMIDLHIEFTPQVNGPPPPNFQPDPDGPTFLEALKEQLGLKLEPQTGPVDVLVLDHVEEPSAN